MRLCLQYNHVPFGSKPEFHITNPLQIQKQAYAGKHGGPQEAVSGSKTGKGDKSILHSPTGNIKAC